MAALFAIIIIIQLITIASANALKKKFDPLGDNMVTVTFTLLSNYTSNCLEGLTPEGPKIYVDYRLNNFTRDGKWIRNHANAVTVERSAGNT